MEKWKEGKQLQKCCFAASRSAVSHGSASWRWPSHLGSISRMLYLTEFRGLSRPTSNRTSSVPNPECCFPDLMGRSALGQHSAHRHVQCRLADGQPTSDRPYLVFWSEENDEVFNSNSFRTLPSWCIHVGILNVVKYWAPSKRMNNMGSQSVYELNGYGSEELMEWWEVELWLLNLISDFVCVNHVLYTSCRDYYSWLHVK